MIEWRIVRGWSETELEERLEKLKSLERNFSDPFDQMTTEHGWHQYYSEAVVGRESPGPPEEAGPFEHGKEAVANYQFSDPRIVVGHFDPEAPLLGRHMLLEMRVLRTLHYLGGVVVGAVRSEVEGGKTVFGFRYDTLEDHIEKGIEWFLLTKEHETGTIRFRIEAAWRPGEFPNWWSRLGFSLVGHRYQRTWHHRAHALMKRLIRDPTQNKPSREGKRLAHNDPDVTFKRLSASNV